MSQNQSRDSVPRLDPEQQKIIEWLRSSEGIEWSLERLNTLESQGHREGRMFTLESEQNFFGANCYTPWDDATLRVFSESDLWIYEPDTVKGLSSPA